MKPNPSRRLWIQESPLRKARIESGVDPSGAAERLGVNRQTIFMWERTATPGKRILDLCRVYGVKDPEEMVLRQSAWLALEPPVKAKTNDDEVRCFGRSEPDPSPPRRLGPQSPGFDETDGD
jgi:DNA-binding XRE family transcriptional regulator